jgi:putative Mn2+ efflux pump MntP
MHFVELIIIAIGVSMDAFAVSICKGLSVRRLRPGHMISAAAWFGGFQALMPLIGYYLGVSFADFVADFDHWIAFVLLGIIGGKMIKEALEKDEECEYSPDFSTKTMFTLAVATSIDALAVGVTFAFLHVDIVPAVSFIGVITFVLSMIGVKIGNIFGVKYKSKAELAGGITLILMGTKILLEHLGVIAF